MKKKELNIGNARARYVAPRADETILDAEEMLCLSGEIDDLVIRDDDTNNWL